MLVTKLGFKPVLIAGLVLVDDRPAVVHAAARRRRLPVATSSPRWSLPPPGLGFAFVPVTIAAVSGISQDDSGLASGLINTSQQIGGALGLAVLATIANTTTLDLIDDARGAPAAIPGALTEGFNDAFLAGAGFAVLGILCAMFLIRSSDSKALVGAEPSELPMAG